MAHKTLVGGTAYNVTSGTSMVSGTMYNISHGKTLVGGTGYDINFKLPATAMLYSDGSFVFQGSDSVASGKTLTASYTDFESVSKPPWNGNQSSFTSVNFDVEVVPVDMSYWFYNAMNMVANMDDFNNLNMKNVTNMYQTYGNCYNLTGSPICGDNVIDMHSAYYTCYNLTGSPLCGKNVINMDYAYSYCSNLTGSPVCGNNVTNMSCAYYYCLRLTGSPVCGNNVTNMSYAYYFCRNLTGSPACGENVTNMSYAYYRGSNLTGSPVCGNNVTNMSYAYSDCKNLTGSPVCGPNVTNMHSAYSYCSNLTGSPVCGPNVTDMSYAYSYCNNLRGNAYFYSSIVSNVRSCFDVRNTLNRLNIYVPSGSTTNKTVHYGNNLSFINTTITWTNKGSYQYNATYNIYIYPVANVAAARAANGD